MSIYTCIYIGLLIFHKSIMSTYFFFNTKYEYLYSKKAIYLYKNCTLIKN